MVQPGEPIDYSLLDRLGVSGSMFYPRADTARAPAGARDLFVEVAPGVQLCSRFTPADPSFPTVLLFHGNGEVASDYDDMAPMYHRAGLNLWVADFRGYGRSNGSPSFNSLIGDASPLLDFFHAELDAGGYNPKRVVMGRSLGAFPATEIAARRPERLCGLVVESGATSLERLTRLAADAPGAQQLAEQHRAKLAGIALPVLVIHGEQDELIPVERALAFYEALAVTNKTLCLIPGAGHNDLWWIGLDQYFAAIERFVQAIG